MARRSTFFFSFQSTAHVLMVVMIAASVIEELLSRAGAPLLIFRTDLVIERFQVWRLVTALFVAVNTLEIIFGALIIYSLGGMLESRWSRRRFLQVVLGIPLTAEILVLIAALFLPDIFRYAPFSGTRSMITTLWILYGLMAAFSGQMLNFWGTPITGKTFALIGVGFVLLSAIFGSPIAALPELICAGLCYAYMYRPRSSGVIQRIELAYYTWKLERLKAKTRLKVVKGMKDDDRGDPSQNIH